MKCPFCHSETLCAECTIPYEERADAELESAIREIYAYRPERDLDVGRLEKEHAGLGAYAAAFNAKATR